MAPEQGPDSKSKAEKTKRIASDEESVPISDNNQQNTLSSDNIGWIYLLKKEQLVEQCRNVGIATAGFTVDYLRKRLAEILRTKRLRASSENLLREVENEIKQSENAVICDEMANVPVPSTGSRSGVPDAEVMSTVQKWNLRFSGDSDLMEFLERTEELAECYQIHNDQLLPAMLGILSGNALKWYRVKRSDIRCWDEFRTEIQKFFLPKRYLSQLEQSFYTRKQHIRERAKDFILNMLTLARQHPGLRNRDHLDRIYDGLRTEYKHYVRRGDFSSLDDLISMTDEFEALKREDRPQPTHTITTKMYDRKEVCWRCKQRGHRRYSCTNERRLFCSYCGRDGTLSISCGCRDTKVNNPEEGDIRYHICVTIGGLKTQALVDTGASKTHISQRVANHLTASGVPHISSEEVAEMADSSLVTPSRRFGVRISYKHKSVNVHVSEIPTLAVDVILGMDFLAAYGIEVRLGGEILPPTNTGQASFLHSLTSSKIPKSEGNDKLQTPSAKHRNNFNNCAEPDVYLPLQTNKSPTRQPKYYPRRRHHKPANSSKLMKIVNPLPSALEKLNRKLAEKYVEPCTAVENITSHMCKLRNRNRKPLRKNIRDLKPPPSVPLLRAAGISPTDPSIVESLPTRLPYPKDQLAKKRQRIYLV